MNDQGERQRSMAYRANQACTLTLAVLLQLCGVSAERDIVPDRVQA